MIPEPNSPDAPGASTAVDTTRDASVRAEDIPLHEDVRWLAAALGQAIKRLEGDEAFETVESLRQGCRARRHEDPGAPSLADLLRQVAALPTERAAVAARAFTLFFLLINTISGVKSVDPLLLKAARSMGTSDLDMFRKVILPASIPSIVSGMRLAVKSSIFAVIGAEMLAAKSGLGFLIQQSQLMMETADMYAGIITMTAIGLLVNYLLVWFERWATAWKGSSEISHT